MSDLSDSFIVAHCLEQSERIVHSRSIDLSEMSEVLKWPLYCMTGAGAGVKIRYKGGDGAGEK